MGLLNATQQAVTEPGVEYGSPDCCVIFYWVSGKTIWAEAWKEPQGTQNL